MGMHDTKISPPFFAQPFVLFGFHSQVNGRKCCTRLPLFLCGNARETRETPIITRAFVSFSCGDVFWSELWQHDLLGTRSNKGFWIQRSGGFREARSTHGALAVARRILDAATKPFGSQCVEPLDLKIAYPNSSRNAFYTVMRHFGASEGILRVIQGLIQLTQYRCRAGKILSEPFTMQRGFKEGWLPSVSG